ncbi:MAG TPA: lipopolysaccharide biosynthesis protein [Kofleriaceae bacterium]|nr:lipopolysaccharide biosynthesis protein [Kofleriaceae bacterium]
MLANGVRVIVLLVLGRLLAPAEIGLVAKAMTVLVFAAVIRDLGLGSALVQHKDPGEAHVRTAFTVGMSIAVTLALALLIGAGALAEAYRSPVLAPMLRVLAALIVVRGLATVAMQLGKRALDFRTLALADALGYSAGAALSIALAFAGLGAWSLIYGYLLETALSTGLLLRKYGGSLRLGFSFPAFRELLRFGGGETVQTIASVIATQGDYVVVGRQLGEAPLGFYQRAYELVRFPAAAFSSIVGSVLFPAFARLQEDRAELGRAFVRALFATALVLLPASVVLIALAPEIIRVVLGPAWGQAVLPFRIMCLGMLFRTNYKMGALVARACGDVYGVALTQILYAATVVGGALVSVRWGTAGVAASTTLAIWSLFGTLTWLGLRHVQVTWRQLAQLHVAPLAFAAACGATAFAFALPLRAIHTPPLLLVATCLCASAFVFLFGVSLVHHHLRRTGAPAAEWLWLFTQWARARRKLRKRLGRAPATAR